MSMPIRRTTARLAFTGAVVLGSAGLLAGPVLAQQPYPPGSIDITVTTPGATITISGVGWGPGTQVTIERKNGSKAGTTATTATVAEDGTFTAPIDVPQDAGGQELQYEVAGVDEQGNERTEARALNVQLTSADMAADAPETQLASPAPAEDGDLTGLALAAAGAVALAGGGVVARRRTKQG